MPRAPRMPSRLLSPYAGLQGCYRGKTQEQVRYKGFGRSPIYWLGLMFVGEGGTGRDQQSPASNLVSQREFLGGPGP
jgi:hypothetical protein